MDTQEVFAMPRIGEKAPEFKAVTTQGDINFPADYKEIEKKNQVVFSSRWDTEKDPKTFLKVAEWFGDWDTSYKFVITTSHEKLQSNDKDLLNALKAYDRCNLEVRENQSKQDYYHTLLESKFQFNCAHQDYISWTLLEAITCGCIPIYPNYLSFPEFLPDHYMYDKGDIGDAVNLIQSFEDESFDDELMEIVYHQDNSWLRMADIMEVTNVQDRYSD
jgi:glycosyltransferase involved in cell wall biosynthesis